jgi:hypothetical protein
MKAIVRILPKLTVALLLLSAPAAAAPAAPDFIYAGAKDLPAGGHLLARDDIGGAQVVYSWKELEPAEDRYDFSAIERDLAQTAALGKELVIQIQDRFFQPEAKNIPAYLMTDPRYGGGLAPQTDTAGENQPAGSGWVARQWDPALRARYQKLLAALAQKFDGRVYGVNLPETAIDLDLKHPPMGFSCDAYF